jgi:hypothetical protein
MWSFTWKIQTAYALRPGDLRVDLCGAPLALARLHLISTTDWLWLRAKAGPQLAEFLQVPVIDQLAPGS